MIVETKYNIWNIRANIDCDGKIRINYELWGDTIKAESQRRIIKKFIALIH